MKPGPIGCLGVVSIATACSVLFATCPMFQWYDIESASFGFKLLIGFLLGVIVGLFTPF